MRSGSIVAVVLIVFFATAVRAQQPDEETAKQVDSLLREATKQGFGGSIFIERKGHVLLSSGYGYANRETRAPFTPNTIAPISSITKSFTALALVQLSVQGKVDLHAPLKKYLTDALEPAASVRIDDVLVHHSGLAEYCGGDWARRTKAQLISVCTARPLTAKPGTLSYSNTGYSFLAAIVEQVSGQTWEDYLQDHVFEPAGMTESGWLFRQRTGLTFAEGYLGDKPQGLEVDRIAARSGEVWNLKGNGGLQSSANDMHRFYRFLMSQPAAVRELMTTPFADEAEGVKDGYSFAFRIDRTGRVWRIGNSGSDGVFLSYFMWLPQQQTFMYFVGNNGEEPVRNVLRKALIIIENGVGVQK